MFDRQGSPLRKFLTATPLLVILLGVTACDQIQQKMGVVDPAIKAARTEEEGKAVGGACRHSGRAIEDCYSIYNWLPKAAVFTGWRDMDGYMRENKIETIEPLLPPPLPPPPETGKKKKKTAEKTAEKTGEEPAADGKAGAKEAKPAEKAH